MGASANRAHPGNDSSIDMISAHDDAPPGHDSCTSPLASRTLPPWATLGVYFASGVALRSSNPSLDITF